MHDVILMNKDTKEVHTALRLTGSCNVNSNKVHTFNIERVENDNLTLMAVRSLKNTGWSVCGHCFPGEKIQ